MSVARARRDSVAASARLDPEMPAVLPYADAQQSPCAGCGAPCCTVLPLYDFPVTKLPDIDYALYLLNFDRIELALLEDGSWRAHYRAPCTNLDLASGNCQIHGTPDQPAVCKKYDAHACFYRRIFSEEGYNRMVRMDRGRVEAWAAHCQFNEHRELVGVPAHAELLQWLPALEPVPPSALPVALQPDPSLQQWRALARGQAPAPTAAARTWAQLRTPCADCRAWCCTRVSFPHTTPQNASQLDHLRFCLGFPGVEVVVDAQDAWTVEVRTRCTNLQDTDGGPRCGVFGQPERPGVCERYDALSCAYRGRLASPRPAGLTRITADAFAAVAGAFEFGDGGEVVTRPSPAAIRELVEGAWASSP